MTFLLATATGVFMIGGTITLGYKLYRHEQRPFIIGTKSITNDNENDNESSSSLSLMNHPSWDAVVDNYVYIHNAFRNHLVWIRMQCEEQQQQKQQNKKINEIIITEFQKWKEILELHSRVEDELFIPILQARLLQKRNKQQEEKTTDKNDSTTTNTTTTTIPDDILTGKDHEGVKKLMDEILNDLQQQQPSQESGNNDNNNNTSLVLMIEKFKRLEIELDEHLLKEEQYIMPLMVQNFTTRELWALDSFIVNPKLGYCDKDMLTKITFWWFANISFMKEGRPLLNNFIQAGKQPPMPIDDWKNLQKDIPALQKFPVEDLVS